MAEKKNDKIIRNRRIPITFVGVVFILIFVYLVIQGVLFLRRNNVQAYNIGSAASDQVTGTFRGMILRDEVLVGAEDDGYISYYATSGERLKNGSLVCTIDENGGLEERLHLLYTGKDVLSKDSLRRFRYTILDAKQTYDPMDFRTAMSAHTEIRAAVLSCLLSDDYESVEKILPEGGFTAQETKSSGFFLLWEDGYEGKTPADLKAADFEKDKTGYSYRQHVSGDQIKRGETAYKLVTDNKFNIVFPLTEAMRISFSEKKNLTIRLLDGTEITGAYSESELSDRTMAGVISFSKFGGNYLDSRFIDFQILDSEVYGYKIPESAVVQKNFFVIDRSYITTGGNSSQNGLMIESDDGAHFVPATVYLKREGEDSFIIGDENTAYVYSDELSAGMRAICMEESSSQERTSLGVTAVIEGVYQINQGYCIFKPILRISNSLDTSYTVIAAGMRYGLQPYDRILLEGSDVSEDDFIYE